MKRIKVDKKRETEGTLIVLFVFGGFSKVLVHQRKS